MYGEDYRDIFAPTINVFHKNSIAYSSAIEFTNPSYGCQECIFECLFRL